jgi:ABC-type Na+ transport system ATPase subunit NatA
MDEAERLCDHIAIIVGGKIVAAGSPEQLMQQTGQPRLEDAFVALAGREHLTFSDYANGKQPTESQAVPMTGD